MQAQISPDKFRALLLNVCGRETSSDPSGWKPNNYLWGHCGVVSLVAQGLFGGELIRASLEGTKFYHMRSHYWNKFPDGTEEDLTASQFGPDYPNLSTYTTRTREYMLSNPEFKSRYKTFTFRLAQLVSGNNPLFHDNIFKKCFYAALDSPCQKAQVGCVISHNGLVVYEGCNDTIEPLRSFCEPTCVRFSISSRTEPMIGACGHAEEGLWKVIHKGIDISQCWLYVVMLHNYCLPWFKQEPGFSCLRCAVQIYNAKIQQVCVPVKGHWEGITAEEAVRTARLYVTQQLKC